MSRSCTGAKSPGTNKRAHFYTPFGVVHTRLSCYYKKSSLRKIRREDSLFYGHRRKQGVFFLFYVLFILCSFYFMFFTSVISSSTSPSFVAQLVHILMTTLPSWRVSCLEKTYFSESFSYTSPGRIKNCWFVGLWA